MAADAPVFHYINQPGGGLKVATPVTGEPAINQLFRTVMLHKGSDLHLKAGLPGMMRLRGVIQKMNTPVLTQETLEKLIFPILISTVLSLIVAIVAAKLLGRLRVYRDSDPNRTPAAPAAAKHSARRNTKRQSHQP